MPHNFCTFTAGKVYIFGVFLVRIFPHSDWIRRDTQSERGKIRTRKSSNTDTFHAVTITDMIFTHQKASLISDKEQTLTNRNFMTMISNMVLYISFYWVDLENSRKFIQHQFLFILSIHIFDDLSLLYSRQKKIK